MTALAIAAIVAIILAAAVCIAWQEIDDRVAATVALRGVDLDALLVEEYRPEGEAWDAIDVAMSETPIYSETCAAEAARIARTELDDDLARMFGRQR